MDNSARQGTTHTDQGKSSIVNGVKEEGAQPPAKPISSPDGKGLSNGPATGDYSNLMSDVQALQAARMDDLPDELQHITADILPLSLLLSRLAQFSHTKLQQLILDLAAKPLPDPAANGHSKGNAAGGPNGSAVNGVNGSAKGLAGVPSPALEDTSPESLDKKTMILNFIQDLHSRWVKALVITQWARNADDVGKLIDIRSHLAEKLELYNRAFWDMVKVKQEMAFAKVPSPDLKTALEVLSTGAVHWMPDFGYLPKPPLTPEDTQLWIHEIEMHLHMRLQLQEYENIPQPFKEYQIHDGRVTFTVPGEFEVDLTIADEDFDKQFWFLDYRPIFSPAASELTDRTRQFIESQVNTLLEKDGLTGCYDYLHSLTLTTKISEFARQAIELGSTGLWTHSLRVERLDRALSIQYWAHSKGSPSWILLGVHGARPSEGAHDPGSPSHLMLQWFREGKEVKDANISFNPDTISVEDMLMAVISKHIEYLLSTIYNTLSQKPRYAEKEGNLDLEISEEDPTKSTLTMQLIDGKKAVLRIGPWLGDFYFLDPSPTQTSWRQRFNALRNPAEEGPAFLERLRWMYVADHLKSRASAAWTVTSSGPAPGDDVKSMVHAHSPASREGFNAMWLRHARWDPQWFVLMTTSLGGDHWWLVEVVAPKRIATFASIDHFTRSFPASRSYFDRLAEFGSIVVSQIKTLRNLHELRSAHATQSTADGSAPDNSSSRDISSRAPSLQGKMATVLVRAGDLLAPGASSDEAPNVPWAQEFVAVEWKGLTPAPLPEFEKLLAGGPPPPVRLLLEAKVAVTSRAKFEHLQRRLDQDVLYDAQAGQFTLLLRPEGNVSVLPLLQARVQALDRLVNLVDAIGQAGKQIVPESITLRKIEFSYGHSSPDQLPAPGQTEMRPWKARFDLTDEQGVYVVLEPTNPHLRVLDFLRVVANSPTFHKIPAWLIFTLPLFQGLAKLQEGWNAVLAKEHGACYVFHKSLDWVTIRFALAGAKSRRVHLDIRPRNKGGKLAWHVYRPATDPAVNNEHDEFNKTLKQRVWSVTGAGFKGLMNGAVAEWDGGIENLLMLVSDAVKSLAGTPPPPQHIQPPNPAAAPVSQPQPQQQIPQQPQQPPQPQQQQQQPPPQQQPMNRFSHLHQQHQQHQQYQQHQQHQHQQQQARMLAQQQQHQQQQQQHGMPQPNMHALQQQQLHLTQQQQQQQQQQQRGGGLGKSNAPVVILD